MAARKKPQTSQEVVYVKTADLVPYGKNPRIIGEDAVEQVAASIREFGFRDPIEVLPDMVILCGHTRRLAAMRLGLEQVPVIIHDMDEEHADMYRLANNKVSEAAGWDFPVLEEELSRLEDVFDICEFGFIPDEPFDDDVVPEEAEDVGGVDDLPVEGAREGGDYVVIVECSSKVAQEAAFRRLSDEGFICRKV